MYHFYSNILSQFWGSGSPNACKHLGFNVNHTPMFGGRVGKMGFLLYFIGVPAIFGVLLIAPI
jgi:hypothetical protein